MHSLCRMSENASKYAIEFHPLESNQMQGRI